SHHLFGCFHRDHSTIDRIIMGTDSNGWNRARGLAVKALLLIGGALLVKRLRKSTTRWDHARLVAQSLTGEKYSKDQASRDPDNYFNIRPDTFTWDRTWVRRVFAVVMLTCPAAELVDGSKVLYFEQAFWRSPQKPFRQRLLMAKPCPKELKCDVEVCIQSL
ncbi:chromophore lyase CpcT/CpeT 3-like protein, partial [Trifolium pratense]